VWDKGGVNFYSIDYKEWVRRLTWGEIIRVEQLQVNNLGFALNTIYGEEKYISELVNNHRDMMLNMPDILDYFHNEGEKLPPLPRFELPRKEGDDSCEINSLPAEIIKVIFSFVPNLEDIFNMCCVCRHWSKLLPNDNHFMLFWKKIFMKTFPEHQVGVNMPWKNLLQTRLRLEKNRETRTTQICENALFVDRSYLSFQTWKVNIAVWSGKWYYEVKVGSMVTALQIGWLGLGCKAKPFGWTMTGVGDDEHSYCWDPIRKVTFWNEKEEKMGENTSPCKSDDVIGVCVDLEAKTITWYFNGDQVGTFSGITVDLPIYAGFTIYAQEGATAKTSVKSADFAHPVPEGYKPLGEGIHDQAILVESIVNRISYEQYFNRTEQIPAQLMEQRKNWDLFSFSDERAMNSILGK
jgi:hypothetical protein